MFCFPLLHCFPTARVVWNLISDSLFARQNIIVGGLQKCNNHNFRLMDNHNTPHTLYHLKLIVCFSQLSFQIKTKYHKDRKPDRGRNPSGDVKPIGEFIV